jgi:hypothetical protein
VARKQRAKRAYPRVRVECESLGPAILITGPQVAPQAFQKECFFTPPAHINISVRQRTQPSEAQPAILTETVREISFGFSRDRNYMNLAISSLRNRSSAARAALICMLAAMSLTSGCDRLLCDQKTVVTAISPDSSRTATVTNVRCGVGAGDGTFIWVSGPRHWYSAGYGVEVAMLANEHSPKIYWIDDKTLKIDLSSAELADLRRERTRAGSVSIRLPFALEVGRL